MGLHYRYPLVFSVYTKSSLQSYRFNQKEFVLSIAPLRVVKAPL